MNCIKKQILVVDDETSIHKMLNFLLSTDYNLVIKQDGAEAISWLGTGNNPDLIISDLEMPYVDGESFIRNLKVSKSYCDTPIILLSGAENLEIIVERMTYRPDYFLKKPFTPSDLKSAITAALLNYDLLNG